MSIRKNSIPILLVAALCGCSVQDDTLWGSHNGGIAVRPEATAIGSHTPDTRAAAEPLAEGSTVRIVAYTDASLSAAAYNGEGCYVVDGGTLVPCTTDADGKLLSRGGSTDGLWVRGGESYHFFAVTPAVAVDATQTPPATNVKNLMDFASSLTSDIVVARGASTVSVSLNTLQRKCAHLSFVFDRVWTNVARTEIQSVTLTQMTDEPQQAAGTGDLPADAAHARTIVIGKPYFTTDATEPWLASGGVAVLPKASGSIELTLNVCFNGSATPTELTATGIAPITFLKGLNYTFRVKLKDGVVVLTLEVEPWTVHEAGGNAGVPPAGSGSGPWEGSGSGGDAGTSPAEIVIGGWTNVVWNGTAGSGLSQILPPGWEGSASGGDAGSGSGAFVISGWQSLLREGDVGTGPGSIVPPGWTEHVTDTEVG